jgi:hypothetical protein
MVLMTCEKLEELLNSNKKTANSSLIDTDKEDNQQKY